MLSQQVLTLEQASHISFILLLVESLSCCCYKDNMITFQERKANGRKRFVAAMETLPDKTVLFSGIS